MNTTAQSLQEALGGHTRSAHFDLYYDPAQVDSAAAAVLVRAHEARYEWGRRRLDLGRASEEGRIQSYIYPSPEVKGRLTGARTTSVSPVWLSTPQVHLLRSRVAYSLGHELAHVLSRPYGLPGLKASWAPGLIEGWAVALEPPSPVPAPDDLVRTALAADTTTSIGAEAEAVSSRLSPWGFWTGRGAVSYATMGSFVGYLLDRYGPDKLKRVYAWGNFESVYGRSLETLADGWARHLRRAPSVARDAYGLVARQFTRPSLFETECPHYVPPARRQLQQAQRAARRRDSTALTAHLRQALDAQPQYAAAHALLAESRLARGQAEAVKRQLDTLSVRRTSIRLQRALADARGVLRDVEGARRLYGAAYTRTPGYRPALRGRFMLRDAAADRPAVLRILTSGDSADVQARRLNTHEPQDAVVRAWQAVRWMDAGQYEAAFSLWQETERPIQPDRPRSWHRAWALQRTAWGARAALEAGAWEAAQRWARRAAQQARTLGDQRRAAVFAWWAARAGIGGAAQATWEVERSGGAGVRTCGVYAHDGLR
jgi:hypothetical protein